MINPDELERLARAAIAICKDDEMDWYMREHFPQLEPEDAAFIAAANPATILALLSANRELREVIESALPCLEREATAEARSNLAPTGLPKSGVAAARLERARSALTTQRGDGE